MAFLIVYKGSLCSGFSSASQCFKNLHMRKLLKLLEDQTLHLGNNCSFFQGLNNLARISHPKAQALGQGGVVTG